MNRINITPFRILQPAINDVHMAYDGQTRSMLETDQKFAGLDSNNPSVKPNADGSYTMCFGPKAHEGNWVIPPFLTSLKSRDQATMASF